MILSIVVIIFVGLIAYMHYIGGILSGLISAVLAVVAMAMAISFYEPLADYMSGGKFNDTAHGICLLAIFALTYLVGRIIFDRFIPGNVRLPHLADSIGGAVMGLFAGMIAMGLVVIALQSMPFGPSVAGYSRFPMADDRERAVAVAPTPGGRAVDRVVINQVKNEDLEKEPQGLFLMPVDDLVVGMAKHLSNGGALSTGKTFASIHPDLLQELFGQRLGIETGGKHTASNLKDTQVSVAGVNVLPPLPKFVGEFEQIWNNPPKGMLAPEPGKMLIAVSVLFGKEASDADFAVRLSPGSVRLVAPSDSSGTMKNYYPIGTVQGGKAWLNKIDDFMFIDVKSENQGARFIFMVDDTAAPSIGSEKPAASGKLSAKTYEMAPGSFIEVKRMAKLSLEGVKVETGLPPEDPKFYPLRKGAFYTPPAAPDPNVAPPGNTAPAPTTPTPTTPTPEPGTGRTRATPNPLAPSTSGGDNGWAQATLEKPVASSGNQLPVGIGVGNADADVASAAAVGHLTNKQFDAVEVDPTNEGSAVKALPSAGNPVQQLFVPANLRMVQVTMTPKAGTDSWAWAPNLTKFAVVDGAGTVYQASGVFGTASNAAGDRLFLAYKAGAVLPPSQGAPGITLTSVTLIFNIPKDQKAVEIRYDGKTPGLPLEK